MSVSGTLSQSSFSGFPVDSDDDIIEFDLRNQSGNDLQVALSDAPPTPSEPAILLEPPPANCCVPCRPPSTNAATPLRSPNSAPKLRRKDQSNLAKLVDELLDSPVPPPASRTVPAIFPVPRTKSILSGIVPLGVRNRQEKQFSKLNRHRPERPPDSWVCPDSWIPNHQCDSFCWDTLRLSIN